MRKLAICIVMINIISMIFLLCGLFVNYGIFTSIIWKFIIVLIYLVSLGFVIYILCRNK